MATYIHKKSLVVFTQNERSGLKSDNDEIIVPAEYDEIIAGSRSFIGIQCCHDDSDDWYLKTKAISFDLEGRQVKCISDIMRSRGYDDFRDVYHIAKDVYGFTHTNNDGDEVLGLFGSRGEMLLKPRYDELHIIDDVAILGYYSPRCHEFEYDWEYDDSYTLLSIGGKILWPETISGHYYDDEDKLIFVTTSGIELIINETGRATRYTPPASIEK